MSINLEKGQRIDLTKGSATKQFYVGLGWDLPTNPGAIAYDLDVSALILGQDKLISEKHFVFYGNLVDPEGAVSHQGDNLTGAGDGDDEVLLLDLAKIHPSAEEISIVVTIHMGKERGQNFGNVKNAFIRICEGTTDTNELMHFDLTDDYSIYTAIQMGSLLKKDGEWRFSAVGQGFKADLKAILEQYGQTATA